MSSQLNTEALQTLLESDFLTLDDILNSLDLSGDDLITALSDGSIDSDSLIDIAQSLYEAAGADESLGGTARATIQTLLEAVNSRPVSRFTSFVNSLPTSFDRPETTAIFAFANSVFSGSDRTISLLSHDHDHDHDHDHTHDHDHIHSSVPAAAFTTLTPTGQRINNGQSSAEPLKWTNRSNGATNVTFAFDDAFELNGISFSRAKSLIASALSIWSQYAPLNFQEIPDPGSGDQVDILVQSAAEDGPGRTIALAYFPTVGDITFDNAEEWTDTKFLETATHELGHSLGLDHEDDVSAIMNSVLGNKFAGRDEPFLLQDDIDGIRNLYGTGRGSVRTLDQGVVSMPEPSAREASNLVINGSFEDTPVQADAFGVYSRIKGWAKISGIGFQVDRRTESVGRASDGTTWIELDTYGQNATVGQNVDTLTGQDYTLAVDFTSGGRNPSSTAVDVFWEGKKIDTLTGGGRGDWTTYQYSVKGSDRNVSTLAFRAIGAVDGMGGFIDNVSVLARANATADSNALGSALQQPGFTAFSSANFAPELIVSEQDQIFPDTAVLA